VRIVAIAAALALLVAPAAAQTPLLIDVEVVVNAPGAGNWIPYIAQHGPYFRDEGLRVSLSNSGTPTTTINLVATNGANIGFDGTDVAVEAIGHELPLRIVASEFIPNPYALLATSPVKTWNDLRGKTVILGSGGDASSITFDLMVAAQGLTRADFTIAHAQTSNARYQALLSGNVAATVLSQPFSIMAQGAGTQTVAQASDTIRDWIDTCVVVNGPWAAKHHATVVRFLRALHRADNDAYAHPDIAVDALVAATGIAPDIARKAYDLDFRRWHAFDPDLRMNPVGLQAMIALAVRVGAIAHAPTISDVYDPSFAREATR
jgi:ABC-type nitrate/sulfonate/bicarbonate transport system substrate-binding protein